MRAMEIEQDGPEAEIQPPHTNTPKSFLLFMQEQQQGTLVAELSEKHRDLIEAMELHFDKFPGKTVGEISVKFKITLDRSAYKVACEYSVKSPKAPVTEQIMWLGPDGSLQTSNPKQLTMQFGDKPRVVP